MAAPALSFRKAQSSDLEEILALLFEDVPGCTCKGGADDLAVYRPAFNEIDADPNQFLCGVEKGARIVGTLQLTFRTVIR